MSSLSASGFLKTRSSRLALLDRADDVRDRVGRPVPDDGKLRDPVALHQLDRDADLLRRVDRDEVGQLALLVVLEAEHLLDRRRRRRPLHEAVLDHPVVVVELREVRAPAVGKHHQDPRLGPEAPGDLERRERRRAARAADEQALLPRQPPRGQERLAVRDPHPLVHDLGIHRLRPRVLADPLDEVRAERVLGVLGVDRPLGVGADDEHLGPALLEVPPDAGDRAARPDGDHDRVDLPPSVCSQISGLVVS